MKYSKSGEDTVSLVTNGNVNLHCAQLSPVKYGESPVKYGDADKSPVKIR